MENKGNRINVDLLNDELAAAFVSCINVVANEFSKCKHSVNTEPRNEGILLKSKLERLEMDCKQQSSDVDRLKLELNDKSLLLKQQEDINSQLNGRIILLNQNMNMISAQQAELTKAKHDLEAQNSILISKHNEELLLLKKLHSTNIDSIKESLQESFNLHVQQLKSSHEVNIKNELENYQNKLKLQSEQQQCIIANITNQFNNELNFYKVKLQDYETQTQLQITNVKNLYEKELSLYKNVIENSKLERDKITNDNHLSIEQLKEQHNKETMMLRDYNNNLINDLKSSYEKEISFYKDVIENSKLEHVSSKTLEESISNNIEKLNARLNPLLRLYEGTNKEKGDLGELVVRRYLEGSYKSAKIEDVSGKAYSGDIKFILGSFRCLIEVKNEVLITIRDIDKFKRDINECLYSGSINCAIFVSLQCPRFPGKPGEEIQIDTEHGIPVVYVYLRPQQPNAIDYCISYLSNVLNTKQDGEEIMSTLISTTQSHHDVVVYMKDNLNKVSTTIQRLGALVHKGLHTIEKEEPHVKKNYIKYCSSTIDKRNEVEDASYQKVIATDVAGTIESLINSSQGLGGHGVDIHADYVNGDTQENKDIKIKISNKVSKVNNGHDSDNEYEDDNDSNLTEKKVKTDLNIIKLEKKPTKIESKFRRCVILPTDKEEAKIAIAKYYLTVLFSGKLSFKQRRLVLKRDLYDAFGISEQELDAYGSMEMIKEWGKTMYLEQIFNDERLKRYSSKLKEGPINEKSSAFTKTYMTLLDLDETVMRKLRLVFDTQSPMNNIVDYVNKKVKK